MYSSSTIPLSVDFDASQSSDADGDPLTYTWDFGDGGTGSGVLTSHTFAQGVHTVTLTVTDGRGGQGVNYRIISVDGDNPSNSKPEASVDITPLRGFLPLTVTLDASATTDADGDPLTFSWHIFGIDLIASGPVQTVTFTETGNYLVSMGVDDGNGGTDRFLQSIVVRDPSDPACKMERIDFGSGFLATVFLSNYGTEPINGWEIWWEFSEDVAISNAFQATVTGNNPYFATPQFNSVISPGNWFSFGFEAFHEYGLSVTTPEIMGEICDNNAPPPPPNNPPTADITASATSGEAPLTVQFSAAGSLDSDGDDLTYTWNFGDGTGGSNLGAMPSHTYSVPGTYTARVTVNDGEFSASASRVITVEPSTGLSCSLTLANLWDTGYQIDGTVTNNGSTSINRWCVRLDFPEPTQVTNYWNSSLSNGSGTEIEICNSGWNGNISPGQSVSFGFQGTHDGSFTMPTCTAYTF